MAYLEFTNEELSTLREVLESDIDELRLEVARADSRAFRKLLKHKEQLLEKILSMLQSVEASRQPERPEPVAR